ncbi:MAG: hypothetical protein OXK76_16060 [Gammaproteobacteria bacterium]|nr:hypothetical protein [Gammaproteobacteria bacterium]
MRFASALVLAVVLASCDQPAGDGSPQEDGADDGPVADVAAALVAETQEGPVTATLTLTPQEPRLGDALVLTLDVVAKTGVTLEMPAFGEALGRFAIVDFTPREEGVADGVRMSQRYTLQAPMSGRQRIPRLRVEYLDERDPGVEAETRELLTDELAFVVASVLPQGQPLDVLRPARASLEELRGPWLNHNWPWLILGLLVVAGGGLAVVWWLRRAEERARLTAFDRAIARLEGLERRGMPTADAADGWYVELSDIVRRYIEERFALRAPELTTEEFLAEAGRSAELTAGHRELLSAFLATCDRVKFARYSPDEDESRGALDEARRFLNETALTREAVTAQQRTRGRLTVGEAGAG